MTSSKARGSGSEHGRGESFRQWRRGLGAFGAQRAGARWCSLRRCGGSARRNSTTSSTRLPTNSRRGAHRRRGSTTATQSSPPMGNSTMTTR